MGIVELDKLSILENALADAEDPQPVDAKQVLAELFDLLEEYGPSWYTEEHHNRAVAALRLLK